MNDAKDILLRVLNHPNLVNLIDVVQATDGKNIAKGYTVWDDCNRGTLNRLLFHEQGQEPV